MTDTAQLNAAVEQLAQRIDSALSKGRRVWILAHGQPSGAQWEVDRRLFTRLHALRVDARPVDEGDLGLAQLVREPQQ